MTFFTIVVRGLMRRPVRTGLTLVGISIGIAAVVALVGISRGFETSWEAGMKTRGTDIVVSNMGSALTPKPFSASVVDRITPIPGVAETCALPQATERRAERVQRAQRQAAEQPQQPLDQLGHGRRSAGNGPSRIAAGIRRGSGRLRPSPGGRLDTVRGCCAPVSAALSRCRSLPPCSW